MGARFIRQPNGLICRFSEVVDDFTHFNYTDAEAVELAIALGFDPFSAASAVKRADMPGRFKEAMQSIRNIHGRERARQAYREICPLGVENNEHT